MFTGMFLCVGCQYQTRCNMLSNAPDNKRIRLFNCFYSLLCFCKQKFANLCFNLTLFPYTYIIFVAFAVLRTVYIYAKPWTWKVQPTGLVRIGPCFLKSMAWHAWLPSKCPKLVWTLAPALTIPNPFTSASYLRNPSFAIYIKPGPTYFRCKTKSN